MIRRPSLALLALLALATAPLAAAQTYRSTGAVYADLDGTSRTFVAFEIDDEDGTAATATWDTGAWIGSWWWIDVVAVEADLTRPDWTTGPVAMLNLSFFVDPATGQPAADTLRTPDALLTEDYGAFWPFYESLPGGVEVTIDAIEVDGGVMRVRGGVTAMLGLVADQDADEPDPAATITLRATFDLAQVARLVVD